MANGGNWERDVCKFISKWIQGTEQPYQVWRGRGSGGTFTRNDLVGESFAGDIYPVRDESKELLSIFSIECKAGYKTTSIDQHLKYNKSDFLRDFWIQTCNDAEKTDKHPMLIYKKKGFKTPWVGISSSSFKLLFDFLSELRYVSVKFENSLNLPELYLFEMKEFFQNINYTDLKEAYNNV